MYEPFVQRKILALIMGFLIQFAGVETEPTMQEIYAENLNVSVISVSCLKVTWDSEPDRDYYVNCTALDPDYAYTDKMYFEFKSNELCYITGLRENNAYSITVEPVLSENESDNYIVREVSETCRTEQVEIIQEFPCEDGWTNCFTGEKSSGLTAMPSSGAIYGSVVDTITETGIMVWICVQISNLSKKSITVNP